MEKPGNIINAYYNDRLPPNAIDAESAVLGAMMLERDAYPAVASILKPGHFYKEAHRIICEAIASVYEKNAHVDLLQVTQYLHDNLLLDEVGGPSYIMEITRRVSSAAHIEFHARIVAQKFIQRELIRISNEILNHAYDDTEDIEDQINFAESSIVSITENIGSKNDVEFKPILREFINEVEHISKHSDKLTGVPSGFSDIDRHTNGWQKTDLTIIAARPSMGKTAFAVTLARNASVDFNVPVLLFSLEMSSKQLARRIVSIESGINLKILSNGRLEDYEWERLNSSVGILETSPVYIDDTPALSVSEFRIKSRRFKSRYDIQLIIVDYLQLMTTDKNMRRNREQEVSYISSMLKSVAKELDIPVIALSQLSRSVESRTNKKPQLSDLRESGAIEQDADNVIFIHRPEYYGIDYMGENDEILSRDKALIDIAKGRNIGTADFILSFKRETGLFGEIKDDFNYNPDAFHDPESGEAF